MIFNLSMKGENKNFTHMYDEVGDRIHKSLVGNEDYIESNIILNYDNRTGMPTCNMIVNADKCSDKEYVREKLKNAIDAVIDNL